MLNEASPETTMPSSNTDSTDPTPRIPLGPEERERLAQFFGGPGPSLDGLSLDGLQEWYVAYTQAFMQWPSAESITDPVLRARVMRSDARPISNFLSESADEAAPLQEWTPPEPGAIKKMRPR